MTDSPDLSGIVKAYDIRGRAGVDLTEEVARVLGAAFADMLDAAAIIVAHDMRVSSPALSTAFIEGAVRRGSTVAVAGLSATDQLYCACGLHRAAGAMFTASHNPAPDNGIKLCLPGARPISRETGLATLQEIAERYLAAGEIPEKTGGRAEELDTLGDYVDTLTRMVPIPAHRRLRVVVDAGNAMAGLTVPAISQCWDSIEVLPLYFELDGTFPHHEANPLKTSTLEDLRAEVVRQGADLGLAFDGDADRCVAVDERGEIIPPSALTALIAQREIARVRAEGEESPAVVANLVSSRHVEEAIEAAGGRRIRSKVGHSLIKALMAQENAVFGGEHSAHYYFRDFFFADSGMLAALHLLAALVETDGPVSALVAAHTPYAASGEINSTVADAAASRARVLAHVRSAYTVETDDLDGLTVVHWDESAPPEEQWWFSLRSSNTEPLLRLNVEAAQEATMERVRDEILAVIRDQGTVASGGVAQETVARLSPDLAAAGAVSGADIPGWVRGLLQCPVCSGVVVDAEAALRCTGCDIRYAVHGGIPMLVPPSED